MSPSHGAKLCLEEILGKANWEGEVRKQLKRKSKMGEEVERDSHWWLKKAFIHILDAWTEILVNCCDYLSLYWCVFVFDAAREQTVSKFIIFFYLITKEEADLRDSGCRLCVDLLFPLKTSGEVLGLSSFHVFDQPKMQIHNRVAKEVL